ncbi:hypothetical protein [Okeania sp. SIO3I5]|nr:hypothetical protein [Okeania sp. SIO3I5]
MSDSTPTDENLEKVEKMQLLINFWQRTFEGGWQTITRQIKI